MYQKFKATYSLEQNRNSTKFLLTLHDSIYIGRMNVAQYSVHATADGSPVGGREKKSCPVLFSTFVVNVIMFSTYSYSNFIFKLSVRKCSVCPYILLLFSFLTILFPVPFSQKI